MNAGFERENWDRIASHFAEIVDLPPTERAARLAVLRRSEPALAEALTRLFAASADSEGFLEELDTARATALLSEEGEPPGSVQIGDFVLLREIGRGGMGSVHLAERISSDFQQRVALKLVKRGLDHEHVLERFRRERQILARLEHPNIARLVDGGSDPEGRPYFAMEYVEGRPITDHCREGALSTNERLELFLSIGEAVRYAHQNLVVHGDLKPSNILVSRGGLVKLLDFGIAKILDPAADDGPSSTQGAWRMLTPDYAAPEQIRGEPLSTPTDVHALGVLLHELLTDEHPFSGGETTRRTEVERRVLEEEPDLRSADSPWRRRHLPRDLGWVAARAMHKDPTQRHPSVEALLRDVRDHLAGRPVSSGPESARYRAAKFLSRHRTAVLLAIGLLVLGGALSIFHTGRVRRERDLAQEEAKRAEAVSDLLVSLFENSDPWRVRDGESLTTDEVLERGRQRIQLELAAQPELQRTLLTVLGSIQRRLGRYDEAGALFARAAALGDSLGVADDPDLEFELAQLQCDLGAYARSDSLFQSAIDAVRAREGEEDRRLASMLTARGALHYYTGEYERAESELREARRLREQLADESGLAYTLNDLGLVLIERGNYAEAESLLQASLGLHERFRGTKHPDVASTMNNLALAYDYQADDERAEQWYRRSLDGFRAALGPDHPQVAQIADNLGAMLSTHRRWEDSRAFLDEAARIRRSRFGERSVPFAETLSNIGHVHLFRGDHDSAATVLASAIAVMERDSTTTFQLASALHARGRATEELGRPVEAEVDLRRALGIWRRALGDSHSRISRSLEAIGKNLERQGRHAEAESTLRVAHRIQVELDGEDSAAARAIAESIERVARTRAGEPD